MSHPFNTLQMLEQSVLLNPSDISSLESYTKELFRHNTPIPYSIIQNYLYHKYGINYVPNIDFSLSLQDYNITELRWLRGIQIPHLTHISFMKNLISDLDGLSGPNSPCLSSLTHLNLNDNKITSLDGLSEFNAPKINTITLPRSAQRSARRLRAVNPTVADATQFT